MIKKPGLIIIVVVIVLLVAGIGVFMMMQDGGGTEETNDVNISGLAFKPRDITVKVGTTVTWTNNDGMTHTVTSTTGLFDSGNVVDGETFTYTFTEVGSYNYKCTIHPSMTGTVNVVA